MKLHNLLSNKSGHFFKVAIVPLILVALLLPPAVIAWADDGAGSFTKDSCPQCEKAGMELTWGGGDRFGLNCEYGSMDPDKPGAKIEYKYYEDPAEAAAWNEEWQDKIENGRVGPDCVRDLSARMACGTYFLLDDQFKVYVSVQLPYSSEEREAVKDEARAIRDQLVACVKASPPQQVQAGKVEKLEGNIIGYDWSLSHLHLTLQYDGNMYETATDSNGIFEFPVKVEEGEEYELTVHFEYMLDGQVFYMLRFRDSPTPVKLVLRMKDGLITKSWIDLGGELHKELPSSDMLIDELRLEKLFHSQDPYITFVSTYNHMSEALEYYTHILGETLDFQLPLDIFMFTDPVGEPTAYNYALEMSWINIDNFKSYHTSPFRPIHREYHEFSHYVMHTLYGGKWPAPVNPSVPEVNHGGYANPSTSDSFVEGFAIFMSIMLYKDFGDTIPHAPVRQMDTLVEGRAGVLKELETDYKAWDREGKAEELAVAGVLWDLYDGQEDPAITAKKYELAEVTYNGMLKLYDANQNGVIDRAEFIGIALMIRFFTGSVDEDCKTLLNPGDQVLMFHQTGITPAGRGEPLDAALLNKYKNNDLLAKYDQDSPGVLDDWELKSYVEDVGKNISNAYNYAKNLITVYDQDKDEMLSETELVRMLAGEELCSGILKKYDLNGDFYIDFPELARITEERGEDLLMSIGLGDIAIFAPEGKVPQRMTLDDFVSLSSTKDDDDIELPFEEMWAILRQYQQDFTAVYESFIDKYPDQKEGIDEIFKAHGFFADVNPQNQQLDAGEEISRAADASTEERKMRRSIQPLPGQFIKVDNDVPYYEVAVLFPFEPYLSYVTRTSNDNGLVYVPIPPESYYAMIVMEAEGVETRNPLTFTTNLFNTTYEESVEQGYFLEYKFEIEGDIPVLPSLSFDESDVSGLGKDEAVPAGSESDSGSGFNAVAIIVPIVVIAAIAAAALVFFRRRRARAHVSH